MKYLLLLNRATDALPEPGTPAAQAMLREYTAAVQAMAEAGVLVDCAPLTAVSAATTVRVRDGQPHRAGTGAARGRAALHPAPPGPGP
jgi:hypothetical protein